MQEHHLNEDECWNVALDIEQRAFDVALRETEGARSRAYAQAASRLLLNEVLMQVGEISTTWQVFHFFV